IRWAGSPGRVSIQFRCAGFAGRWRPAYYRLPQRIRNAARDANHHSTLSVLQSIQRIGGRISPAPELWSDLGWRPAYYRLPQRIRNAARDANHHSTLSVLQSIQRIGGRISPAPELWS